MGSDPKIAAMVFIDGEPVELPYAVGFAGATDLVAAVRDSDPISESVGMATGQGFYNYQNPSFSQPGFI